MNDYNPYQPPVADVADPPLESWVHDVRTCPVGSGWRWIEQGYRLGCRQPITWIVFGIIWMFINVVFAFLPGISWISNILQPTFVAGWMLAATKREQGERLVIEDLFLGFKNHFGSLALLGFLQLVAVIITFLIAALVVVPFVELNQILEFAESLANNQPPEALSGDDLTEMVDFMSMGIVMVLVIVVLNMLLLMGIWFAPALMVLRGVGMWQAVRLSFTGCLKNWLPFLWYGVVALVGLILSIIPLFLGLLVMVPILMLSIYCAFREIFPIPEGASPTA